MATAAATTEPLHDPRQYVRRRGVAVFDAHVEKDQKGKVVRKFSRADLEEIARECNRRAAQGSYCPLTLGHTDPDQPDESKQPPVVGYAKDWRVAYSRRLGRWVIEADFYVKRERWREAQGYPRVSVELWPADRFFDPVALLRRTPQRDLGQWTYARGASGNAVIRYSMDQKGKTMDEHDEDEGGLAGLEDEADEAPLDEGADAPPGDAPADAGPADHEIAEHFAKHCAGYPHMDRLVKRYAMPAPGAEAASAPPPAPPAPAAPAHDPAAPPDAHEEPETYAMAMPSATNGALPAPAAGKDDAESYAKKAERLAYGKAKAREAVASLASEGFNVPADEEERMARMEPLQRKQRYEEIRRYWRKAPVGGAPVPVAGAAPAAKRSIADMGEAELKLAVHYMKSGLPWEKAARKAMRESGK